MTPRAAFRSLFIAGKARALFSALALAFCASGAAAVPNPPQFILETSAQDKPVLDLKGFSGLNIRILDDEGNFFCYAPNLVRNPFVQRDDLLSDYLSVLDKQGSNEAGGIKIFLDLSPLGSGPFKLSSDDYGRVVSGLASNYVFTGATTDSLPDEALNFTQLSAANSHKKLILRATCPAFEKYVYAYAGRDQNLTRSPDLWVTSEDASSIAAGDLAFGLGRALAKEVWPSSQNHNLLLYRAVQHLPPGYFITGNSFKDTIRSEILELYREFPENKKPVANLVLGASMGPRFLVREQMSGIVSALTANGFEIRVTFESFMKGADLYYVIGRDEWLDNLPFFDKLIRLLDTKKSHVYSPVILHPVGEIKNRSRWKNLRKHFHVPDTEVGWVDEIPEFLKEKGKKISWGGGRPPKGAGMTFLRADAVRHAGGQVVLSDLVATQTLALIIKSKNHFLVNGNPLELEAGYILSRLMGGALRAPTLAFVDSGRHRTAAYAVEDTHISVKIPTPEPPREWRKVIFDENGKIRENVLVPGSNVLETDLLRNELLVLEAVLP